ncbi:MAG: RAMP superfamily CRISPR-associated protein [Promethearchaeia archaeon]
MTKHEDKISQIFYIKGTLTLLSPLILGSGEMKNSDNDLIRNGEGNPFIPATSLAGTLRSFLFKFFPGNDGNAEDPIVSLLFGEKKEELEKNEIAHKSLLSFYDQEIISEEYKVSIRDGVKIDKFKNVAEEGAKYNYEILEPHIEFTFYLKLIIREKHLNRHNPEDLLSRLYFILYAMKNNYISIGAKTNRGYGRISLNDLKILRLDMKTEKGAEQWINFEWHSDWDRKYEDDNLLDLNNLCPNNLSLEEVEKALNKDIFTIQAQFSIPYSVLIRSYNPLPSEEDVKHLTINGTQIIPGTSWAGAIRSALNNIKRAIKSNYTSADHKEKIDDRFTDMIKALFGYVDESADEESAINARASKITVHETEINHNKMLSYSRNCIDRFTGGAIQGGLFSEKVSNGGDVKLIIELDKPEDFEIGLLILAIFELSFGLQPIGGTSSIGRGLLKCQSIEILENNYEFDDFKNSKICNQYLKQLKDKLEEGLGEQKE